MEIFTAGVDLLQMVINIIGGAICIIGIITYLLGQGESNAAQKNVGAGLFVAGAGIALVGIKLVPMLASGLSA